MTAVHFSSVLEYPAASPAAAAAHFAAKLSVETDPADVKADMDKGVDAFIVVDVRSPEAYREAHVPGAINFPYRRMNAASVSELPKDKLMVTYCTSHSCNASTKGALKLAELGFNVKEMIGGLEAWRKEGYPVESGT